MKTYRILFFFLSLAFIACKDKSTNTNDTPNPTFSYETSKCSGHGLSKGTALDSIFTYSFDQELIMDFSVLSNCCPDSGRFVLNHTINMDTILIAVSDTAQHLCRCICSYMIHTQLTNLPLDQYVVRIEEGSPSNYLLHLAIVKRKK
jgi:hypothetical protein